MITQIDLIDGVIRGLVWWIVSALLSLFDLIFDFVKTLLALDFLNLSDNIWMWFWLLTTAFTGFFVVFRVFKNYSLDAADVGDDREMRINPSRLITRLIALELVILLAQPVLSGLSWVSSSLIDNISVFTGTESTTISSVILEANGIEVDANGDWDIEVNEKVDDEYVYFDSAMDMVFLIVIVALATYQMFFIVLGVGERLVSMLVKLILSPWAFSSIVEQNPQTFATWCRLFIADFMSNFVICFMLVAGCSVVIGADLDALPKCILLVGVLIGLQTAPQVAAHLIGADIGMSSGMRSLQTLMSVKSGLSAVGGAALTAGAMGVYGVGRAAGGISRHDAQLYSGHDAKTTRGSGSNGGSVVFGNGGSGGSSGTTSSGGGYDGAGTLASTSSTTSASGGSGSFDSGASSTTTTFSSGGSTFSGGVAESVGSSSSEDSVTRPSFDKNPRKAYDDSFAHRVASHEYKNKFTKFVGSGVVKLGGTLYERSARRLNRKEVSKYGSSKQDAGRSAVRRESRA